MLHLSYSVRQLATSYSSNSTLERPQMMSHPAKSRGNHEQPWHTFVRAITDALRDLFRRCQDPGPAMLKLHRRQRFHQ